MGKNGRKVRKFKSYASHIIEFFYVILDSNKFGQKLLEKMGWTSGKGLGKQENGVTEHVKVSLKTDSKGKFQIASIQID